METTSPPLSPAQVAGLVERLKQLGPNPKQTWLGAVARRVLNARPDISPAIQKRLGVQPLEEDLLAGLGIETLSICYEALLATLDHSRRRRSGQYFTPDDAAQFMASQAEDFPEGTWLDPCSGVGNLSWHLVANQENPAKFLASSLTLIDKDPVALASALALIAAQFAGEDDVAGVDAFFDRGRAENFLTSANAPACEPACDYAILNPPYARAEAPAGFETASARDLFAFFLEKVMRMTKGFIAVTPASYLSSPKYKTLRALLDKQCMGGKIFVFDNVPDTLFRGFKFGSKNTSTTNFVRAAVTVCEPGASRWCLTPIIRWRAESRQRMFAGAETLLSPRQTGPRGEWAKVPGPLLPAWNRLREENETVGSLIVPHETPYRLDVATTPRYYISAAYRNLERGSKTTLRFKCAKDRDRAAAVLNSSIPYFWWRTLDGGVTFPMRVLLSVPVGEIPGEALVLAEQLNKNEDDHVVTKLNAGRVVENVKRPREMVAALDRLLLPEAPEELDLLYSPDLFAREEA